MAMLETLLERGFEAHIDFGIPTEGSTALQSQSQETSKFPSGLLVVTSMPVLTIATTIVMIVSEKRAIMAIFFDLRTRVFQSKMVGKRITSRFEVRRETAQLYILGSNTYSASR